jgi:hypothetical protein
MKEYECGFTPAATLGENISLLMKLIKDDIAAACVFDRPVYVFSQNSGRNCLLDQTLEESGISEGSVLLVC